MEQVPYEPVYITARDGAKLAAGYYHVREGAPFQIQVHGYRGSGVRDFCGGNKLAREAGHNTLVVTQRAHGESSGNALSFGIRECRDVLDWVDYVNRRFGPDTRIILSGVSMGAATVIMASQFDLPDNVCCILADSPYSSPRAIIRKVCGDMHLPAALAYPFVRLGAILYGGFDPDSDSPVKAVKKAQKPILIIHGEDDAFVPCSMSKEIQDANPAMVERHTFPGAGHALSFLKDLDRYRSLMYDFMERYI